MKKIFDFLHFAHPTEEQSNVLKAMEEFVSPENQYDFMVRIHPTNHVFSGS